MRFDAAIPEGALAFWLQQGGSLLNHVASANRVACEVIGEWLAQETSDRQTLLEIYDTIPAKAVEQALLDCFATELSQAI